MTVHELKTVRWELSIAETLDIDIGVPYDSAGKLRNQPTKGRPKSDMGNPGYMRKEEYERWLAAKGDGATEAG